MKARVLINLIIVAAVAVGNAQADITGYLNRYRGIEATRIQKEKLLQYDHIIQYFCALPYFSENSVIHPDFLKALILAESNGNPRAVSDRQAHGLTQILYPTGRQAARALLNNPAIDFDGLRYVHRTTLEQLSVRDLHDPAVNIFLACYLIAKYNQAYKGRLDLVVSAWNAGTGSIKHNRPPNYKETLNLIGKVNGLFCYLLKEDF